MALANLVGVVVVAAAAGVASFGILCRSLALADVNARGVGFRRFCWILATLFCLRISTRANAEERSLFGFRCVVEVVVPDSLFDRRFCVAVEEFPLVGTTEPFVVLCAARGVAGVRAGVGL